MFHVTFTLHFYFAVAMLVRRPVGAACGACTTMNAVTDKALARPATCCSQRSDRRFMHRRRSSVNFRGHDIFARKICMKN